MNVMWEKHIVECSFILLCGEVGKYIAYKKYYQSFHYTRQ